MSLVIWGKSHRFLILFIRRAMPPLQQSQNSSWCSMIFPDLLIEPLFCKTASVPNIYYRTEQYQTTQCDTVQLSSLEIYGKELS